MEKFNSEYLSEIDEILAQCILVIEDDYTQMWTIAGIIDERLPGIPLSENRVLVKHIVKYLMDSREVKVIDEETEKPSEMTSDDACREIDLVYERINRLPNIGDGPWFG